jgi:alpha-1,2-mannosyltransferase
VTETGTATGKHTSRGVSPQHQPVSLSSISAGLPSRRRVALAALVATFLIFLAVSEAYEVASNDLLASDFKGTIWEPARAVINGDDPYAGFLSVYPPSAFVPLAWLGLVPFPIAGAAWIAVTMVVALLTLHVLGVRDARCFALWMLNCVVLSTALTGNATIIVGFFLALVLRFRDSTMISGLSLGAGVAIKLFVAPMALWLLITGRARAVLVAAAAATAMIFAAWATIRFEGLSSYLARLDANDRRYGPDTPLAQGLVQQLGGSSELALAVGVSIAIVLLAIAWRLREDGTASFALVLAASVVASPIAWVGYATLLIIPLAARSPRYHHAWLLLLGFSYLHWWHSPLAFTSPQLSIATIALMASLLVAALRIPATKRTGDEGAR